MDDRRILFRHTGVLYIHTHPFYIDGNSNNKKKNQQNTMQRHFEAHKHTHTYLYVIPFDFVAEPIVR